MLRQGRLRGTGRCEAVKRGATRAVGARPVRTRRPGGGSTHPVSGVGCSKGRSYLSAAMAILLVLLGTAGSVVASTAVARSDTEKSRRAFAASSPAVASNLKLALQHEEDLVVSTSGYVISNPNVSTAELRAWAANVRAAPRYPELQGLAVVVLVPRSQLAAFATRAQADAAGPPGPGRTLVIIPPGDRPFYCFSQAVGYTAPGVPVLPAGLDVCSTPLGPMFLDARDSGRGAYVPNSLGGPTGLIVETPVYRGGLVPTTVEGRRSAFLGEIATGVAPKVLLDRALEGHSSTAVTLRYRDDSSDVAFSSGKVPRRAESATFDLGNDWSAQTFGVPVASGVLSNGNALALLLAGIMLSVMLGALARALNRLSRKTAESRHQALHDALTGLPNRALIMDRIEQLLARNRRNGTCGAALFVDIDEFKNVNDSLGHEAGDQLIRAVATRLTESLRNADTIGRMGGDEFVILVEGGPEALGPERVAERLLEVLREPFELGSMAWPLQATASVGVAIGDRGAAVDLLRDADLALYQAKAAGKDGYAVFHQDMESTFRHRLERESELRLAIEARQLRLDYQPIYSLITGDIDGVEALVRWEHPTEGTIPPSQFIPLAEETGLIVPLGEWVLGEACRQAHAWHRDHPELSDLIVGVNLSGRQLAHADVAAVIANVLATTGLRPDRLFLEITESVLMHDADHTVTVLTALKALGVRVGVDDFGTGYSSLSYLKKFPVDILKIDKSFVDGLGVEDQDTAIVGATITLAHALGLLSTAEGVETAIQAQVLTELGCDKAQGYLYCRPQSASTVIDTLLRTHARQSLISTTMTVEPTACEEGPDTVDPNAIVAI
jgi:diguanylate cyclase (GGDEF)-like protein